MSSFLTFKIHRSSYDYTCLHSISVTLCMYLCVLKEESMYICIFVFTTELRAVKKVRSISNTSSILFSVFNPGLSSQKTVKEYYPRKKSK